MARFKSLAEVEERAAKYFEGLLPTGGEEGEKGSPPTVCGLARELGFCSRQELLDYIGKNDGFTNAVMRARMLVEEYAESMLYQKETARAAEFVLRCNFGWGKAEGDGGNEKSGGKSAEPLEIIFRGFEE